MTRKLQPDPSSNIGLAHPEKPHSPASMLLFPNHRHLEASKKIYGRAAILAAKDCRLSSCAPKEAWDNAINGVTKSPDSRTKCCPRGAFLGLCEDGLVDGIPRGTYILSGKKENKEYAVTAVGMLRDGFPPAEGSLALWPKILQRIPNTTQAHKAHNGQMDVVLALWCNGFIVGSKIEPEA